METLEPACAAKHDGEEGFDQETEPPCRHSNEYIGTMSPPAKSGQSSSEAECGSVYLVRGDARSAGQGGVLERRAHLKAEPGTGEKQPAADHDQQRHQNDGGLPLGNRDIAQVERAYRGEITE